MSNSRYVNTEFKDLTLDIIKKSQSSILLVKKNGINVYLKIKLKENSPNLVVFSNGAINLSKSTPPVFSRSSWASDFNANCIYIDDATIHGTNMTVGWGVGTKNRYYLKEYSDILYKISLLLNINAENTIYFGSSAGGFMSIMLAIFNKGSIAIANNPQIWVRKESQASRAKNLYDNIFPNMSEEEIFYGYGTRLSVIKMMKEKNYIPKIIYLLNRYSDKDVNEQYKPFIEFIDSRQELDNSTEFLLYHSGNGHNGIYTREKTAQLVNGYFKDESIKKLSGSIINNNKTDFEVKNHEGNVVKTLEFKKSMHLPKDYIIKNYYSSRKFIFSQKKGRFKLTLRSTYFSANGKGNIQYEILKNGTMILCEDMAEWQHENNVFIYNLNKDDEIEIRVKSLRNNRFDSWSKASRLEFLNFEEKHDEAISNVVASVSSPYSKIFNIR